MEQALHGIRVMDFSHLLQGPFATQMLGDLGADIIKIERPDGGDAMRSWIFQGYKVAGAETPTFLAWNRNKRSIAVDLKADGAAAIVERLAERCDVLVENFRPGVMDKLGFGYERIREINPRIIYCSGSGYGPDGPYVSRPGQDLLLQGFSGLMGMTGRDGQAPTPLGVSIADQLGAYHMVYGILAALYYREKTRVGQRIDVSLFSALLAHQGQELAYVLNRGEDFHRPASGIGHPGQSAPFGVYRTADGWISIAISPMSVLGEVLAAPELAGYEDAEVRYRERDAIHGLIEERTRTWESAALIERLLARGVWCAEIKSHLELADDPQVRHLEILTSYEHPDAGTVRAVNVPIRMSETPGQIHRYPPRVGEHTREILTELGFSDAETAAWEANGVVAQFTGRPHTA